MLAGMIDGRVKTNMKPRIVEKLPVSSMVQSVRQSLYDSAVYAKQNAATQAIVIARTPDGQIHTSYAGCTFDDKIALLEIVKNLEIRNGY